MPRGRSLRPWSSVAAARLGGLHCYLPAIACLSPIKGLSSYIPVWRREAVGLIGKVRALREMASWSPENGTSGLIRIPRRWKAVELSGKERDLGGYNESRNSGVESVVMEEVSSRAVEGSIKSYDEREVDDLDVGDLLESSSEFGGGGTTNDDSWLVYAAGLIIKAIGIQLYLLVKFLKFPFKVFYVSCLFFIGPFGTVRRVRSSLLRKLLRVWNGMWAIVSPYLGDWFGENKSLVQFLMRYGWGLFTAGYGCVVLFSFLVFAIIGSGFMMGALVEKPMKIEEKMNFD